MKPAPGMHELKAIAHRVMIERGLQPDFTDAALAQAKALDHAPTATSADVRDLRALLWCSIDNDSSRDLDQLSVGERLANGDAKILVAIADVDAAVPRGSPLDGHAQANTTSVYTAAEIFPMLPEKLSTNLTSLNEDQERLALVVEFVVRQGQLIGSAIYRARVFNRAKLAYDSVAAWLDGKGPAPSRVASVKGLDENLRLQDSVAQEMRKKRLEHGALELKTIQAEAVFEGETLADLKATQGNRAKQLIEDFMIGANGCAARFLAEKKLPSIRRVLKTPKRWERIVAIAAELKEALPKEPSAAALSAFLEKQERKDPARFADLSLSVVKLLGRGEYALDLPGQPIEGHFGLAVTDYAHSTAPNRRFPDLITQRLIKAALTSAPCPYPDAELDALAKHCTEQENNAAKVERQVLKSAAALLLQKRVGEHFTGMITGANKDGIWVRIFHPAVEGKLIRNFQGVDVGDPVEVLLLHADVERGFIDFARVESKSTHT